MLFEVLQQKTPQLSNQETQPILQSLRFAKYSKQPAIYLTLNKPSFLALTGFKGLINIPFLFC